MPISTNNKCRLLNIAKVIGILGENLYQSLLCLHTFIECDTISIKYILWQGPKTHSAERYVRRCLLSDWLWVEFEFRRSENTACFHLQVVCSGPLIQMWIICVNDLRFCLWCAKKGDWAWSTLNQHARTANYQSAIWRRSLEAKPSTPAPEDGHGRRRRESGGLCISWMTGLPVPDMILEFISCKCCRVCQMQQYGQRIEVHGWIFIEGV